MKVICHLSFITYTGFTGASFTMRIGGMLRTTVTTGRWTKAGWRCRQPGWSRWTASPPVQTKRWPLRPRRKQAVCRVCTPLRSMPGMWIMAMTNWSGLPPTLGAVPGRTSVKYGCDQLSGDEYHGSTGNHGPRLVRVGQYEPLQWFRFRQQPLLDVWGLQ